MIYVGIDVSKNKHDCFAYDSDGVLLIENLTIDNDLKGFNILSSILKSFDKDLDNIKVGLEATGHYSNNLLNYLHSKNFKIYVLNSLHTNLYRKSLSLRKTKTDKLDAKFIANMVASLQLEPYSPLSYNISELKSLTRYRFQLIGRLSRFKISYSRLVTIVFPELESAIWSIHQNSILELLLTHSSTDEIASCHLTKLTNILKTASKGKYGKEKALELRDLARNSIGFSNTATSLELKQTIEIIQFLSKQINTLDKSIKKIMDDINSPILSIPGISYTLGSMIIAEIANIDDFDSPSKLQAFAGLDPAIYQSGKFNANNTKMVKRGSKYLRYALLQAAVLVPRFNSTFADYQQKKINEGKHHFVVNSHIAKKLVRVIFALLKNNTIYKQS